MKIYVENNELRVGGELTQDTAMMALGACEKLLTPNQNLQVNLREVTRCDSAGLAFLMALLREGNRKKIQLRFTHLPKQLLDLIRVSGLDDILPVENTNS